jgi:hypothetical protein
VESYSANVDGSPKEIDEVLHDAASTAAVPKKVKCSGHFSLYRDSQFALGTLGAGRLANWPNEHDFS